LENQEENSLKEKVRKLEMVEDVYVTTTFFIMVALIFLAVNTLPDLIEIIQSGRIHEFLNEIVKITLIYLIILIEIFGFLVIRSYNRKHPKEKE
jgi:positive regulator of sigma E activity